MSDLVFSSDCLEPSKSTSLAPCIDNDIYKYADLKTKSSQCHDILQAQYHIVGN